MVKVADFKFIYYSELRLIEWNLVKSKKEQDIAADIRLTSDLGKYYKESCGSREQSFF